MGESTLESGPGVMIWIAAAEDGEGVKAGAGVSVGKELGNGKGVGERVGDGVRVADGSMVGVPVGGPVGVGCVGVERTAMVRATTVGKYPVGQGVGSEFPQRGAQPVSTTSSKLINVRQRRVFMLL
jgi:hypothetical protein